MATTTMKGFPAVGARNLITVVGVGALGSHLVQLIRNLGVPLRLIDFDRIEQKNITSQFHGKPHVGRFKSQSLKEVMGLLWGSSSLKLDVMTSKLTADNAAQMLRGSDLVVDCLDNGEARRLVQAHARGTRTPCLHGALAADGVFGRVVWDEDFIIDDESVAGEATCEGGEHLPFIALVSACMAQAIKEWLASGKKIGFSASPSGLIKI